jgi:hypothetical protein
MSAWQYLAAALAVVIAFWPILKDSPRYIVELFSGDLDTPKPALRPIAPSYQTAIAQLAMVRLRLVATKHLSDDQRKSIDVLTLALVDGSDQ